MSAQSKDAPESKVCAWLQNPTALIVSRVAGS
ncbi:hypothetical protein FHW71_004564 [Enterobacter sp. Sphag1F]|nr:hypothetical protein [Enterobacter sp. Sphag1F]NYI16780.1 hypothetical protein [Enterobacter sp. Sphag71]